MIRTRSEDSPNTPSILGRLVAVHELRLGDVFEFVDFSVQDLGRPNVRFPHGMVRVAVRPWGARLADIGPVSPWMFACKDDEGRFHHHTVDPRLQVKLLQAAR